MSAARWKTMNVTGVAWTIMMGTLRRCANGVGSYMIACDRATTEDGHADGDDFNERGPMFRCIDSA